MHGSVCLKTKGGGKSCPLRKRTKKKKKKKSIYIYTDMTHPNLAQSEPRVYCNKIAFQYKKDENKMKLAFKKEKENRLRVIHVLAKCFCNS